MNTLKQALDIQSLDPEDARRRKLLNILLLGIGGLTLLALISFVIASFFVQIGTSEEIVLLYGGIISTLVSTVILYVINRFWSGRVAAIAFLIFLLAVLAFADTPEEVAGGRTLFFFTLPIIMGSVLLQPYFSFIVAAGASIVVTLVGQQANLPPNIAGVAGFFAIALVSWLAARSLQRALLDLHQINRELDQRVNERTRELYEALRQVSAESSKNQAILESIADGVIVFDQKGTAFVSNASVTQLVGRSAAEINGQNLNTLMGSHVHAPDQEMLLEFLKQESKGLSNIKVPWDDKVLSVTSAPVRDNSGVSSGTVVVFRDFTREAQLDRMKSAFVSMASHELRTPLNAILGYSDMLKEGVLGPLAGDQVSTLERVIANVHRMLALVNNLLDQAQMEAGGLKPHVVAVDIRNLVRDVQSTMKVLAQQKGLDLTYNVASDIPPMLSSDPQRIQQILINLIGNAIKFTEKGSVDIRIYQPRPEQWALTVADTGPGIPPDAQGYVFEPFRQVEDPVRRKHGGSGLGLSIVKQLTNLLGGEITLQSTLGIGTTFTAVFPMSLIQEQPA